MNLPNPYTAAAAALVGLLVIIAIAAPIKRYGDKRYDTGKAEVQAKWDKEKAKVADAARRTLVALRRIDAANAAKSAADAKRFHDERQTIAADAARWRSAFESGRVRVGARFTCPASGAAASPGAFGDAGTYGLTQADAGFLVGFAGERDRIASERNEAVTGWQTCRRISAEEVKP